MLMTSIQEKWRLKRPQRYTVREPESEREKKKKQKQKRNKYRNVSISMRLKHNPQTKTD